MSSTWLIVLLYVFILTLTRCASQSDNKDKHSPSLPELNRSLTEEFLRLCSSYNETSLNRFVLLGGGAQEGIGQTLTKAFMKGGTFTVGVTGGSATAGDFSWPNKLLDWLRRMGISNATVRNAAQGTTSQLVTAPCIRSLVGDHIDLLLWEFAMNDEFEHIDRDVGPVFPMRRRVAEAWIREAISLKPKAIGFVHIWDLTIHSFEGRSASNIPNKAFHPTTTVMDHYQSVFNRYFSLDTMGMIWHKFSNSESPQLLNMTRFLRDSHHPNDFCYNIIADLISFAILKPWMMHVKSLMQTHDKSPYNEEPPPAISSVPLLSVSPSQKEVKEVPLPWRNALRSHCYMSALPQFSTSSPIGPVLQSCSDHKNGTRGCGLDTTNTGRSDVRRQDRALAFTLKNKCAEDGRSGGSLFRLSARKIGYILIDCGYNQIHCGDTIHAYLDGRLIGPNVDLRGDIMSAFYSWTHKVQCPIPRTDNESESDSSSILRSEVTQHDIRICPSKSKAQFTRLVAIEEVEE